MKKYLKQVGHVASNLGVVELTIALHSVFNLSKDRLIWDVGHQTYVHKILTGRKDRFDSLRQLNGMSGFPKTSENIADCFNTGHSSTSISAALGMARARDLQGEDYNVIAVIGDGALTGGMAQEALNDAGNSNANLIVILNDNEMSISRNVGGMCRFLSRLRTKEIYTKINLTTKKIVTKIPLIGKNIYGIVHRFKSGVKQNILPNMFFEDIGFTYLGPVDGHNIEHLEEMINRARKLEGPVLVHVITKKGKGYKIAEENPSKFHGIGAFNIETGETNGGKNSKDYSKVFGEKLCNLAKENEKIVAITAAMKDGTGLSKFAKEYPNRFFDVGIAEQHATTLAAGMAMQGLKPVFAVYSSFMQRAYDQLLHDICMQNLPVVICLDRAGIVGADGETHQGIFDLSYLSHMPNLTVLAPKDFKELEQMLEFAMQAKGPVVIRYPRGAESKTVEFKTHKKISLGKSELIQDGTDLTIIAIGKMVATAKEAADILKEKHKISAQVINSRFLRPLDDKLILESAKRTKKVFTIEDNVVSGGFGCNILSLINNNKLKDVEVTILGYPDEFIKQGKTEEIEEIYGLTAEKIVETILKNDIINR